MMFELRNSLITELPKYDAQSVPGLVGAAFNAKTESIVVSVEVSDNIGARIRSQSHLQRLADATAGPTRNTLSKLYYGKDE